ncbi:conserved Plasmodium protein, unknown function [Plasmodium knowlesi strain H]|uniref:Uncharacterized protein n=3 Tax=Plasmodium knowlesi TaxID=5850 RepID=A0A5K1V7Z4_PLAKH|nr:conserved Plasmodium protein, unknown function [Plasmodium knowlesi strain H]OTN67257.1 Uncharacterized protein PKNOH_S06411100 [Plasmodium knowlesi]CAA9987386.1 conserved Plasmodium protein, unknown function [Plasmodium knowlesi strain H]SBO23318.1 conserved Plasmodium protein, unknown function [Plasmodium knowlesi strain H]SBO24390.1 conserved Plasmodium protein, unknown function [Plasmodium knowlesi strain H]VVS76860.1 conserved Plasmodium protein, unknown function [Plasmodium knowlesi s|eukprot:XP_002258389.1 hypothetical protein, conserved in Plasmodium species [Plasmodium knowlesi strain H]
MKGNGKIAFCALLLFTVFNIEARKSNKILEDTTLRGAANNWKNRNTNPNHACTCKCTLKTRNGSFKFINFRKSRKTNYVNNAGHPSIMQLPARPSREIWNEDSHKSGFTSLQKRNGVTLGLSMRGATRCSFLFNKLDSFCGNYERRMNSSQKNCTSEGCNIVASEKVDLMSLDLFRYKYALPLDEVSTGGGHSGWGNIKRRAFSLSALPPGGAAVVSSPAVDPTTTITSTSNAPLAQGNFYAPCVIDKRGIDDVSGPPRRTTYGSPIRTTECGSWVQSPPEVCRNNGAKIGMKSGGQPVFEPATKSSTKTDSELTDEPSEGRGKKKRVLSEEAKQSMREKLRVIMRNKWKDPEFRKRMMKSFKKRGLEHKKKISETVKNKWKNDMNYKQKTLDGQRRYFIKRYKNQKVVAISEKTREKISKAMKQYWVNKNKFAKTQVNNLQHIQKRKKKHKKVWEDIYSLILNQKVGDFGGYQSSLHHNLSINLQAALN